MKQLHVCFEGHVQGVGFRFTVEHISRKFAITGFVRNSVDGGVELVAEGEESELNKFLEAIISSQLKNYIHQYNHIWREAAGSYKRFSISF